MFEALSGFVIIGLPILVGYVVARVGFLAATTGRQLNLLAFYVLIPFMLFTLMMQADLSAIFSGLAVVSFLVAVGISVAYAVFVRLRWKRDWGEVTIGALTAGYTNAGNIGLPVALHLLGNAAYSAPIILFQTCILTPVAMAVLEASSRQKTSILRAVGSGFRKPLVIGSLGGLLVSLLPWEPPELLLEATDTMGRAAIPVMLIAFGMALRGQKLLGPGEHRKEVLLASGLKLLGMPLLAWLLGHFCFGLVGHELYVVTTLAALPSAQNLFNYAVRYDKAPALARDAISVTTLGSAPVILLIALLLGG